MKKLLLSFAVLCTAALSVNAQTEKGRNFIGGSIGYSSTTNKPGNSSIVNEDTEFTTFDLLPKIGHFFSKNLAVGLGVGYRQAKNVYTANTAQPGGFGVATVTSKNNSFNVSPFVRYYIDVAEKFKFYGQGSGSAAFGKMSNVSIGYQTNASQSKSTFTSYTAAVNPGFAFFPAKKWAIEFSFPLISYAIQKTKNDDSNIAIQDADSKNFSFGLNTFSSSIGLNYHF